MLLVLLFLLICCTSASPQNYAERSPIPLDTGPIEDPYDDYDYDAKNDFNEEPDIYRWNVEGFPHPQNNSRFCNRLKPSFVCDPDQILQKAEADKLDTLIQNLYKETLCICNECKRDDGGILVGIALLKNMFMPYNEHPSKIIRTFTETLRKQWNLGKCDNDILIAVVVKDRLSFTDVGRATSSYLSREEAHRIFLENKAKFSAGHFYEGLRDILDAYHARTRTMRVPQQLTQNADMGVISGSIVGAILVLGVMLFIIFLLYRRYQNKNSSEEESPNDDGKSSPEGVSSGWKKQDIKVLFSSLKSTQSTPAKYQPCETEEQIEKDFSIEEDAIDTTLASPEVTTERLDQDLAAAVEDIALTFQPKRVYKGHETDL